MQLAAHDLCALGAGFAGARGECGSSIGSQKVDVVWKARDCLQRAEGWPACFGERDVPLQPVTGELKTPEVSFTETGDVWLRRGVERMRLGIGAAIGSVCANGDECSASPRPLLESIGDAGEERGEAALLE